LENRKIAEIISMLNSNYFQYFPSIVENCIETINNKKLGITLLFANNNFTIKLLRSDPEGNGIIVISILKELTTQIDFSVFEEILNKNENEATKLFKMLIDQYPNLSAIVLPVPCSLSPDAIMKINDHEKLDTIYLDLSKCKNANHFKENFSHLSESLTQKKWKIELCNTEHLRKSDAVQILPHFPQSHSVCLDDRTRLTNQDLLSIVSSLPNLQKLSIQNIPQITDEGISYITEYSKNLTHLWIQGCTGISDVGISSFLNENGERLTLLDLGKCNISTATALCIGTLCESLKSLNFANCIKISDSSINAVANGCPNIENLNLQNTQITDNCADSLVTKLKNLQTISLYDCIQITNSTVEKILLNCRSIVQIDRRGTSVAYDELMQLRLNYPNVRIK